MIASERLDSSQQAPQHTAFERLRFVVADASPQCLSVVCALLALDDVVDIVGRAASFEEAFKLAVGSRADVVLIDLELPLAHVAISAIGLFARPGTKIIGMTLFESISLLAPISMLAVNALVHKERLAQELPLLLHQFYGDAANAVALPTFDQNLDRSLVDSSNVDRLWADPQFNETAN